MKPTVGKHTEDDLKLIQELKDMCKEKPEQYVILVVGIGTAR